MNILIRHCILLSLSFSLAIGTGFSQHDPIDYPLALADSLLGLALENEGLYTLYGGLKPLSTVAHFRFAIDSVTMDYLEPDKVAKTLEILKESIQTLSNDSIGYAIIPFKAIFGKDRAFEVLVYHKHTVGKLIQEKTAFFLKRGVFQDTPMEKLLVIYEFEEKYDRYRAYGYLFGYPDHAVDFFVEASRGQDDTGEFVQRDFFQIPVASAQDGRFVYAVPKGYEPRETEFVMRAKAAEMLKQYRIDRLNFEKSLPENSDAIYFNLGFMRYLGHQMTADMTD